MNRIRLAFGLLWPTKRPPIPWIEIGLVIGCLLVYGLVSEIDRLGDRAAEMEKAGAVKTGYRDALINCMNGGGFYFPDTKAAFICEATQI
jgi:hypothetical protein